MDVGKVFKDAYNEVKQDVTETVKLVKGVKKAHGADQNKMIVQIALKALKFTLMAFMAGSVALAISAVPIIASVGGLVALASAVVTFVLAYDAYRMAGNVSKDMSSADKAANFMLKSAAEKLVEYGKKCWNEKKMPKLEKIMNEKNQEKFGRKIVANRIASGTILKGLWSPLLAANKQAIYSYVKLASPSF